MSVVFISISDPPQSANTRVILLLAYSRSHVHKLRYSKVITITRLGRLCASGETPCRNWRRYLQDTQPLTHSALFFSVSVWKWKLRVDGAQLARRVRARQEHQRGSKQRKKKKKGRKKGLVYLHWLSWTKLNCQQCLSCAILFLSIASNVHHCTRWLWWCATAWSSSLLGTLRGTIYLRFR